LKVFVRTPLARVSWTRERSKAATRRKKGRQRTHLCGYTRAAVELGSGLDDRLPSLKRLGGCAPLGIERFHTGITAAQRRCSEA
jgi:hypothetical protein